MILGSFALKAKEKKEDLFIKPRGNYQSKYLSHCSLFLGANDQIPKKNASNCENLESLRGGIVKEVKIAKN